MHGASEVRVDRTACREPKDTHPTRQRLQVQSAGDDDLAIALDRERCGSAREAGQRHDAVLAERAVELPPPGIDRDQTRLDGVPIRLVRLPKHVQPTLVQIHATGRKGVPGFADVHGKRS
ncbi:MAG: hypothetical protein M3546_04075 [Actinomycetota bacterium]|nr:hypothetical protein [Actinomycetota bacterium]